MALSKGPVQIFQSDEEFIEHCQQTCSDEERRVIAARIHPFFSPLGDLAFTYPSIEEMLVYCDALERAKRFKMDGAQETDEELHARNRDCAIAIIRGLQSMLLSLTHAAHKIGRSPVSMHISEEGEGLLFQIISMLSAKEVPSSPFMRLHTAIVLLHQYLEGEISPRQHLPEAIRKRLMGEEESNEEEEPTNDTEPQAHEWPLVSLRPWEGISSEMRVHLGDYWKSYRNFAQRDLVPAQHYLTEIRGHRCVGLRCSNEPTSAIFYVPRECVLLISGQFLNEDDWD